MCSNGKTDLQSVDAAQVLICSVFALLNIQRVENRQGKKSCKRKSKKKINSKRGECEEMWGTACFYCYTGLTFGLVALNCCRVLGPLSGGSYN